MAVTLAKAEVIRIIGDRAVIRSVNQGCGRCQEPGGCGGFQTQAAAGRAFEVENGVGASAGDLVEVAIDSGVVLKLAALTYLLPLGGVIGGAVLGNELGAGPAGAVVGAMAGYLLSRNFIRRQGDQAPAPRFRRLGGGAPGGGGGRCVHGRS